MCGIVGQLNFEDRKVNRQIIRQMAETLRHRGPDDEGFYFENNLGFGHKRLAIIDLKTGHQPIFNEDRTIVVIFNGEIYNFLELKKELEKKHQFKTKTDTEVIIHLYEEDGEEFVKKLNGDFALALWDKKRKQFFLARDRLGVKPLFYFLDSRKIIFGSEIKAILAHKEIPREMNFKALNKYFSYLYIPGRETIFKGIKKLLPGHFCIIKNLSASWRIEIKKYWDLRPAKIHPALAGIKSEQEYVNQFRELLADAIKIRLLSDVPLGVLLSGGMDSSSIVALLAKNGVKIKTFSINCGEGVYNELAYARLVAKKYDTEHYEFQIKPDLVKDWPKIIQFFDEPYGNSSALPSYWISQMIKKSVTVFLSGEGGDEVLSGYSWYRLLERIIDRPLFFKILPPATDFLRLASLPYPLSFQRMRTYFPPELKEKIYSEELKAQLKNKLDDKTMITHFNHYLDEEPLNKALYTDLKTFLPEDLLRKLDRTGMAHSLEGRVPFLDHRLVEFTASLPYKLRKDKFILRKAMKQFLPKEILTKQKRGMAVPISKWLMEELKDYAREIISTENRLFNCKNIEKMLQAHLAGKKDFGYQLFGLISFFIWEKGFSK